MSIEVSDGVIGYTKGVITGSACGTSTNHDVLAVGFGTDGSTGLEYFLVKNSWGTTWGENGYIKIGAQLDGTYGVCGILKYPLIATWNLTAN